MAKSIKIINYKLKGSQFWLLPNPDWFFGDLRMCKPTWRKTEQRWWNKNWDKHDGKENKGRADKSYDITSLHNRNYRVAQGRTTLGAFRAGGWLRLRKWCECRVSGGTMWVWDLNRALESQTDRQALCFSWLGRHLFVPACWRVAVLLSLVLKLSCQSLIFSSDSLIRTLRNCY